MASSFLPQRRAAALLAVAFALACARAPSAPPAPRPAALHAEIVFASYWGAQGGSAWRSVVFDGDGSLYVVGGTQNAREWPQTAPANGPLGFFDVVVAKFAPDGRNLWSRLIGGTGEDYAYVAALDRDGNLVVGGRAGPAFPVTPGAYDTSFGGGHGDGPHGPTDGFVMSLATADGALRWATYLGGNGDELVRGIELLPDGAIAVSGGNSTADDLPTTPGVLKPRRGGAKDAYVAVLEPNGSGARSLTWFGPSDDAGKGDETVRALGWDARGRLWLAGTTQGTDLAATAAAFQRERDAGGSTFVAQLTPDGRQMPYFSWLGGRGDENVETEGVSTASGAFAIAGASSSADLPVTPGAERGTATSGDGMVARIEPDGRLGMALRFGGTGFENFFGPALGANGTLFVSGSTDSTDLPVTEGAPQPRFAGGPGDALLAAFSARGALELATYFGGSGDESGRFVAFDAPRHRVALIGETNSADLPLRNAAQSEPGATFLVVYDVVPAVSPAAR